MQMKQKADFNKIKIVEPKLLKQNNDDDCALFVLHYVENILGSVDSYAKADSFTNLDE